MPKTIIAANLFLVNDAVPFDVEEAFQHLRSAVKASKANNTVISVSVLPNEKQPLATKFSDNFIQWRDLITHQKLPRIGEIIGNAVDLSDPDDLIIYLNADINVPYYFLDFVRTNINALPPGSGLVINRKDVSEIIDADLMASNFSARPHIGFDCMAFPAAYARHFELGSVTVGLPPIGSLVVSNMLSLLPYCQLLNDALITWHNGTGDESAWHHESFRNQINQNFLASFEALNTLFTNPKANKNFKHMTQTKTYIALYNKWLDSKSS